MEGVKSKLAVQFFYICHTYIYIYIYIYKKLQALLYMCLLVDPGPETQVCCWVRSFAVELFELGCAFWFGGGYRVVAVGFRN